MPISFKEFNIRNALNTGGVTGSIRVVRETKGSKHFYQLKPSILSNKFLRRLKAGDVDRENFGEVIAAKIGRSILQNPDGSEAVPDVSLVYDPKNKQVSVASKYLTGKKVRTLDDYAQEQNPKIEFKRHATFVDGTKPISAGQYNISGDKHKEFRQGLANAIVVSALVGDHDVNPGNMMAVDNNVARIDFGHAFNDLLNTARIFGGGVRNKKNQMLDFLNREKIASVPADIPKLWRDYPGMVPSQELANAFKEMSQSDGIQQGIYSAKTEFQELISELERNNDIETQKHVLESLKAINNAIEGRPRPIRAKTTLNEAIEQVFDNIGKFCTKNQQQMMGVSKLMQLQIDIDKTLKSASKGTAPSQEQIDKIKSQYAEITKIKGIGRKNKKSIRWIKTSADTKAFKGNLQGYIKERSEQLGLGRDLGRKVAHQQFKLPKKQNFFRRLFNSFRKEQEADILRGLINKELPITRRISSFFTKRMKSSTVSSDVEQEVQQLRQSLVHEKFIREDTLPETRQKEETSKKHSSTQTTEIEAVDTVIFSNKPSSESLLKPRLENTPSVNLSDTVDPITQAIRDEIITTQQLFLKQEIAKSMEISKGNIFQNRDLAFVRAYLETGEGKEAVKEVMKKPLAQMQMHEIESKGYKAVHNKFQDSFQNIDWGQREEKVRSTKITDTDDQIVCTLKESTFDVKPTIVTLEDGTSRSIRSYRQIDFPKELETSNGPMHVSMALKDQNGHNMPERDAVYFTAHYDDSGKLTEVSSPVPVKFMGTDDDAIGYIERNGKVFTLPVTQEKYREIMQEVAKNQGMTIDISQKTETVVQDKIIIQETEAHKKTQHKETLTSSSLVEKKPEELQKPKQLSSTLLQELKAGKILKKVKPDEDHPAQKKPVPSQENPLMNLIQEKLQERRKHIEKEDASDNPFENLNEDQTELASKILSDIIKEGNVDKVVEALSQLDASWVGDEMSREDYRNAYNNAMSYAKSQPQVKHKIHRATAEVTTKAGIENHVQRVKQNTEVTSRRESSSR